MIGDLISKSVNEVAKLWKDKSSSQQPSTSSAEPMDQGIPTLKKDIYREPSPMLTERYELLGRWTRATHGSWLSLLDMEELWKETPPDDLLNRISINRMAAEENWPNDAAALFRPERLSLFPAATMVTKESTCCGSASSMSRNFGFTTVTVSHDTITLKIALRRS